MDMPLRQGSCLHGDAGDNTDDPGAMTRECPCCDLWMSENPFKEFFKNVHLRKKTVTVVLRAGTPLIKIWDDPWCDPWMCERPFNIKS